MAEGLSIEQTNELRIKLGLKPLEIAKPSAGGYGGSSEAPHPEGDGQALLSSDADRIAADNYERLKADEERAQAKRRLQEQILKNRDRAKLNEKLDGKGLGDADEDDNLDVRAWIKKTKLQVRAENSAAKDVATRAPQKTYTAVDVAGLCVGHDVSKINTGKDVVLTLQDANVLDEEPDQLISTQIVEENKLLENIQRRKQPDLSKPQSDSFDEKNSLLSKYDEEIEGKKKEFFILSDTAKIIKQSDESELATVDDRKLIKLESSLPLIPESDYMDAADVKIRKRSKRQGKAMQRKKNNDDEGLFPISTDQSLPAVTKRRIDDISFVDDEDVAIVLARQRREVLKKRKKEISVDILKQLEAHNKVNDATPSGIILDDTTEFLKCLDKQDKASIRGEALSPDAGSGERPVSVDAKVRYEPMDLEYAGPSSQYHTGDGSDVPQQDDLDSTGLGNEGLWEEGMGTALQLLQQKGFVKSTPVNFKTIEEQSKHEMWLLSEKKRIESLETAKRRQREEDRRSGKLAKMTPKERELYAQRENQRLEYEYAMAEKKRFENYKPDVTIDYIDEFGRKMTPKEAFKFMSHKFHGKGSGKAKTERRLVKIAREQELEKQTSSVSL